MALLTFSGVVVPLSASVSQQTFTEVALVPTVGPYDSITRVNIGLVTSNPPPTTGIVYPLFR